MIDPVIAYFEDRIFVKMADDVELYKTCRYANPMAVKQLLAANAFDVVEFTHAVQSLRRFPQNTIDGMVTEIPNYLVRVNGVLQVNSSPNDQMAFTKRFWSLNRDGFPFLIQFIRYVFTLTTSSAAAERAFSILKNSFGEQQTQALEDYVQLSCMFQYNGR